MVQKKIRVPPQQRLLLKCDHIMLHLSLRFALNFSNVAVDLPTLRRFVIFMAKIELLPIRRFKSVDTLHCILCSIFSELLRLFPFGSNWLPYLYFTISASFRVI